jgi:hypothetical protein
MPKFTLTCEHTNPWTNESTCKNTHEFEVETLSEVLENFELFLRGAGYIFDGVVDVVPTEEDDLDAWHEDIVSELDKEVEAEHSKHYFDVDRNKPVHAVSSPVWPFAAPSPKTFGPHPAAPDEWTQVIRGEGT